MASVRRLPVFLLTTLLAAGAPALSGCAVLLLGAGAAGGYAVSRDSVVDHLERSREVVYRASLAVAQSMGQVTLESPKQGVVQATIDDANVRITIRQVTTNTVELRIRARNKLLMPKVEVAQRVTARIKDRL